MSQHVLLCAPKKTKVLQSDYQYMFDTIIIKSTNNCSFKNISINSLIFPRIFNLLVSCNQQPKARETLHYKTRAFLHRRRWNNLTYDIRLLISFLSFV